MLGLAGVLALIAGAAEVSIKVLPATPCVVQTMLVRKVIAAGLKVTERPGRDTLMVTLSGDARVLMVRAKRGELPFERRVPVSVDDCVAVERVTVALISAWATAHPEPSREAPDAGDGAFTAHPEPRRGAPTNAGDGTIPDAGDGAIPDAGDGAVPDAGDGAIPDAGDEAITVHPEPVEGPLLSDYVPSPEVLVIDAGTPELPVEEVLETPVTKPVSPHPNRREGAVLAGVSGGPTPVATAAGSLLVGFSLGRWGVLLEAGLESELARRMIPVRVTAGMQWLSISFRVAFELLDSLTLDFAAGARGWRIVSKATGVDIATDKDTLTAGPVISAGLSFRIVGPLFLHFRPSIALRAVPLSLSVDPLGEVLRIGPWTVAATLGALFRFE